MTNNNDLKFVNTLYAQKNSEVKTYVYMLFFTILALFILAVVWASWAQIDELARGEGKVIPSSKIQTIQSFDGGSISEILVKGGSFVSKGQALMKIDTTRYKADLEENTNILENLLASQIRLVEETKININKEIPELNFTSLNELKYKDIIKEQRKLFSLKVEELISNVKTLKIQVNLKRQELIEIKSKKSQLYRTLKLVEEELKTVKDLVKRKAKSKFDLLSVKKELNAIAGEYESTKLSMTKSNLLIKESQNKIIEKMKLFKSSSAKNLEQVNIDIQKYESKAVSKKDKLDKTIINSPVDGIIKQINKNTIGGVVRSGEDLIEIVPNSEVLLVEARIKPKDIAFINPKQNAIVKITAYDFSIYGGLDGKIIEISADSIKDEDSKTGETYYKVVIQTHKNYLMKNNEKLAIIPGMIASVDIVTGKKSIMDFLLKPILKTKNNAFHER